MEAIESVLNPDGVRYVEMVDDLALEGLGSRYTFYDPDEFEDLLLRDLSEGMRVYWSETLQRAHLAAVTAILRSRRWISGVAHARTENNLLVFAAALRGLMESAADASTALVGTPLTLANRHSSITNALVGQASEVLICTEVEDELIHYSHGRKLYGPEKKAAPESHQVRQVQDYLRIFGDQEANHLRDCYSDLCDLTHPGASSVAMWLTSEDKDGLDFTLSAQQDEAHIATLLRLYPTVHLELLMFAFNAPVITLNVLNYFPIVDLHTPRLLTWHLDSIPGWVKCRDELHGKGIRPKASAR